MEQFSERTFQGLILEEIYRDTDETKIVYLVVYNKEKLVLKKMKLNDYNYSHSANSFIAQIHAFGLLRHDSIARIKGQYFEDNGNWFCIVMKYYKGGSLGAEINKRNLKPKKHWKNSELLQIFKDLIKGFYHLQCQNIVHGNISPNFILNEDNKFYITALEYAYRCSNINIQVNNEFRKSDPTYMSPILADAFYNNNQGQPVYHNPYKSDVYSLGLVFLSMATLDTLPKDWYLTNKNRIKRYIKNLTTNIPDSNIKELVLKMLSYQEKHRPNFEDLARFFKLDVSVENSIDYVPEPNKIKIKHNRSINEIPKPDINNSRCFYCEEQDDQNFIILQRHIIHPNCLTSSYELVTNEISQTAYLNKSNSSNKDTIYTKDLIKCRICGDITYTKPHYNDELCLSCFEDHNHKFYFKIKNNCKEIFDNNYCQKCFSPAEIRINTRNHICCYICAIRNFEEGSTIRCPWSCCRIG